jgi:hypothetical protein
MKGIEELEKAYVYLAITLLFVSFTISPLYETINAGIKNSARLEVKEIAGAINMVKSSTSNDFFYTIDLPKECKLKITNSVASITVSKESYSQDIIQTPVSVIETGEIDCSINRKIEIRKKGLIIEVLGA